MAKWSLLQTGADMEQNQPHGENKEWEELFKYWSYTFSFRLYLLHQQKYDNLRITVELHLLDSLF